MASASFGNFLTNQLQTQAAATGNNPLGAFDYNAFVAANGRAPSSAEDFQNWQANAYLQSQGQTPQQWLSGLTKNMDPVTLDSSGNVNWSNHGDSLGEFIGIPALFAGMAAGAGGLSSYLNGGRTNKSASQTGARRRLSNTSSCRMRPS